MKWIVAFLLSLPMMAAAQDSCHLKRETDPFTHQVKVSTGFVPFTVSGAKLNISIDATATDIDFLSGSPAIISVLMTSPPSRLIMKATG